MNKKIKVIELFDIIAKGVDIPNKVEYEQKIYKFDSQVMDYIEPIDKAALSLIVIADDNFGDSLNREVEILEDEEIDIQGIEELKNTAIVYDVTLECEHEINKTISNGDISKKINEILRAVKQLDKKINKEE